MCKWLGVKSHEFQARWALGDGAAKGSPGRAAGICGLPVALQTGCRPTGAFARASCFSLLPLLKVKAALVEGPGKKNYVKRVDWLKRRLLSSACTSGILL